MAPLPLSVCMIARDEQDAIGRALASVAGVAAEVVVADTGSRDGTPEVAAAAGARVHRVAWADDFAAARNASLALATQPWILVIDADETLVADTVPLLARHVERAGPDAFGLIEQRNALDDAARHEVAVAVLPRILPRRPDLAYRGRVHEQPVLTAGAPTGVLTGVAVDHGGYLDAALRRTRKLERNLALIELALRDEPDDPYHLMQLGRTLRRMGRADQAAAAATRGLERLPAGPEAPYAPGLHLLLAQSLIDAGRPREAIAAADRGLARHPDYTDLAFARGTALLDALDPALIGEIPAAFARCLAMGEPPADRYETVAGVGTFRAHHNLGAFLEVMGDRGAALQHYRAAAAEGFPPSLARLAALGG